jgi:hypothetical protein
MSRFFLCFSVIAVTTTFAIAAPGQSRIEFNRDIRPILSDKCFGCHGPDSGHRKAGLRLDRRQDAILPAKSGAVPIAPGDTAKSHILERVVSKDADEVMPPPESKLPAITKTEAELLRRWIQEGAEYEPLWSFIPLRPIPIPETTAARDVPPRNGMDRLLAARLSSKGLTLRREARRETLLRRVHLDLTGLPPTPEKVREFLEDPSPDAYEKTVDHLLASPAFGEKFASDWLDVSRYADSYGFQVDRDRNVWQWRDWVVDAFNRNLPFDQFVTWQLAGDLLPNATDEQVLATAFNRLHQQESEGGSVEEEYRVEYVSDRVQTFGTAFLGITLECAKCHDHKFDPISQKDFYRLFAFFDDIEEAGLYAFFHSDAPTPAMRLPSEEAKKKEVQLQNELLQAEEKVRLLESSMENSFAEWLLSPKESLPLPAETARFTFDGSKVVDELNPQKTVAVAGDNKLVPGRSGQAVQFSGDDRMDLPAGNFNRSDRFTISLWIQTPDKKERAVVLHRSKAWTDAASRGFELLIEDNKLKWSLIRFWPGDAASIQSTHALKTGEWIHVALTSDGSGKASGLGIYINGEKSGTVIVQDSLTRDITPGKDNISLGERMRDRGFKHGLMDEVRVFACALAPVQIRALYHPEKANEILRKSAQDLTPGDRAELLKCYQAVRSVTPEDPYAAALESLKKARNQVLAHRESQPEMMVMREMARPKKSFVLFRGQYDQRRDEVEAGTPESLPPFPAGSPRNRLGLARWLTDPGHPLLARVTVNRFWQSLFGKGLVRTAEDFGSQGATPEYPELLDWLASSFISSGWDVKALLRTIVLSQTYRQESTAPAQLFADDPENTLLARGPRFRMSAEMIRDSFLSASGLLVSKMGGPPVIPYEMSEAFRPAQADKGDGSRRRSLYTRWRRTSPPPAMMAFDASRRAVCSARRERTNTPLQALILLNGPQYLEAARAMAERLFAVYQGNEQAMIENAFLSCLSRLPDDKERDICTQMYQQQLEHFRSHPAEAVSLRKIGQAPPAVTLPNAEVAAATVVAHALLNHDGFVVKQ